MKKKVLLSSIGTIVLCLCLIAGSTFALFTDDTEFNIAATAGKVDVEANAEITAIYSAEGAQIAASDFLVDENGNGYTHKTMPLADGEFLNGGTVDLTGNSNETLKIDRITPGDKVDVKINLVNSSNVAISYRYIITVANDGGLASGMVLTIDGKAYEGFASYTSAWSSVVAAPQGASDTYEKTISIELPVFADNRYQEKSVEYNILVEAVQGNAVTTDESEVIVLPAAVQNQFSRGGEFDGFGSEVTFEEAVGLSDNATSIKNVAIDASVAPGFPGAFYADGAADVTFGANTTVIAPQNTQEAYALFAMGDNNKITLDDGCKLVFDCNTTNYTYGILFQGGTHELYLNAPGIITLENAGAGDYGIYLMSSAKVTVYVPDYATYQEYSAMTGLSQEYNEITWCYTDGTLIN